MQFFLIAVSALLFLNGCYTQMMTYSAYPVVMVRDSAAVARDSLGNPLPYGDSTKIVYVREAPVEQNAVTCTPFEIQSGLCWTTCDRCGYYHRFGYDYCPSGYYSSYGGWDYYNDFPWWYDRYNSNRGYGDYNNRGYGHYRTSGASGSSSTVPKADNAPFIGDRQSHRSYVVSPPPSSGSGNSVPKASVDPSPAPASAPPPAAAPADTSSGSRNERPMNRNRLR